MNFLPTGFSKNVTMPSDFFKGTIECSLSLKKDDYKESF